MGRLNEKLKICISPEEKVQIKLKIEGSVTNV